MLKRRTFLKVTGIAMAGQALGAATLAGSPIASFGVPTASAAVLPPMVSSRRLTITEPGEYQISGFVRLHAPSVQITGISNSQQITWSNDGPAPLVSFTSLESYTRAGATSTVQVLGGQIESVSVTPMLS
jgi:hypothetical protein